MKLRLLLALAALALIVGSFLWKSTVRRAAREFDGRAVALEPSPARVDSTQAAGPHDIVMEPAAEQRAGVEAAEPTGYLITVVDVDGSPIAGAEAHMGKWTGSRRADAAGVLRFDEPGYEGILFADGYLPRAFEIGSVPLELRMERDPGLALTLLWDDGTPVAGARVEVVFELAPGGSAPTLQEIPVTDVAGRTIVRPYRIGRNTADLRILPPGAPTTLLDIPDDLDHSGAAVLEARVARRASVHSVRVVDSDGRPLAGREVTFHWHAGDTLRTDGDGRAEFGDQATIENPRLSALGYGGFPPATRLARYTVEVEPGRSWWFDSGRPSPDDAKERTVRVAPQRVFGRVESPTPASYLVATAATIGLGNVSGADFYPEEQALIWTPVRDDGSFELFDGWQGPECVALLRHRDSTHRVWIERVPEDGGPVVLRAPSVCRVTVDARVCPGVAGLVILKTRDLDRPSERTARERSMRIQIDLGAGFGTTFPLESAPNSIELPCARYEVSCFASENEWVCEALDATGPQATLRIDAPELLLVRGRVSGSMRGPLVGARVRLRCDSLRFPRTVKTDQDGWFAARMPADGYIIVESVSENGFDSESSSDRLSPSLGSDRPIAEYVIPEGLLQIAEQPPSPLLHAKRLALRCSFDANRTIELDENGWAEIHLAPGRYELVRRFDAAHIQKVEVTVVADERVQAVLDSSRLAMLAVAVEVTDPERRELVLRVRDAQGKIAALDSERRMEGPSYEFHKLLDPGVYEVEVESRRRGASLNEAPIDVWRGEIDVRPGARAPLRIRLR